MPNKLLTIVGMGEVVGYGVVKRFAKEGFRIAMIARSEKKLIQFKRELNADGFEAHYFIGDSGNTGALKNVMHEVSSKLGITSVLIYNAARKRKVNIAEDSAEELIEDFKVNVAGALTAAQLVLPSMKENREGTIIFTGGGLSMHPNMFFGSLAVGKAGLKNLTQSLAQSCDGTGIKIGTVTITDFVTASDIKYNPNSVAEKFWILHKSMKNGADIVY